MAIKGMPMPLETRLKISAAQRGQSRQGYPCLAGCNCGRHRGYHQPRHGMTDSPTYASWRAMLSRCRPGDAHGYFEMGITVCDRWNPKAGGSFENFLADMGERPEGTSIDRIDNYGSYKPGNCRWATQNEQRKNQRPFSEERRMNLSAAGVKAWSTPEKRLAIMAGHRGGQ